ncbi:MAG: hypothetical protein QM758_23125 [Armatimonas sp.]
MDYQEFAMVIGVPTGRDHDWARTIQSARPPAGISCQVRSPELLLLQVQAETEWEGIEKVERWLHYVGQNMLPPVSLNLNPQPSSEV